MQIQPLILVYRFAKIICMGIIFKKAASQLVLQIIIKVIQQKDVFYNKIVRPIVLPTLNQDIVLQFAKTIIMEIQYRKNAYYHALLIIIKVIQQRNVLHKLIVKPIAM